MEKIINHPIMGIIQFIFTIIGVLVIGYIVDYNFGTFWSKV